MALLFRDVTSPSLPLFQGKNNGQDDDELIRRKRMCCCDACFESNSCPQLHSHACLHHTFALSHHALLHRSLPQLLQQ
jgi:hypothetical protein